MWGLLLMTTPFLNSSCSTAPEAKSPAVKRTTDQLLLEWIKFNQDTSSPDQRMVGDILEGHTAQTFNNALTAMAFMVMDERERAERILDFYAGAADAANTNHLAQNFFFLGQARGFYQNMAIKNLKEAPQYVAIWNGDRWMGDMSWLLIACKQYEKKYNSDKYARITGLLRDLIVSWYIPEGDAGYVGSGWRHFDEKLHEENGHPEGNIDAIAVLQMTGDHAMAERVKQWLLPRVSGGDRPLDLFTWKVLTFGKEFEGDLEKLETFRGYKKTLTFNGKEVTGFTSSKTQDVNIWGDGLGHVACAYYAVGNVEKGDYYLGELEKMALQLPVDGRPAMGIPYCAAKTPGYEWVNPNEGFVSCAAWYIFAKHRFNPMRLE